MNLKSRKLALLIFVVCLSAFGCTQKSAEMTEITERKIIFVKIPPVRDEKLSDEERYWQMQKFLFPQRTIPNPIPKGLPNDHSLFYVKLGDDGTIELNRETQANAAALQKRLTEIFESRAEKRVFEPESDKVAKGVLVIAPDSAKYGEVFSLVEVVEKSGADPIVLRIGELPTTAVVRVK